MVVWFYHQIFVSASKSVFVTPTSTRQGASASIAAHRSTRTEAICKQHTSNQAPSSNSINMNSNNKNSDISTWRHMHRGPSNQHAAVTHAQPLPTPAAPRHGTRGAAHDSAAHCIRCTATTTAAWQRPFDTCIQPQTPGDTRCYRPGNQHCHEEARNTLRKRTTKPRIHHEWTWKYAKRNVCRCIWGLKLLSSRIYLNTRTFKLLECTLWFFR